MTLPIAIIPARGGSRRIPKKNLRPLAGIPLLTRAINVLSASQAIGTILVSTDDAEIADVATESGARVLGLRGSHLSDDHTPTLPVVQDTIRRLEQLDNVTVNQVVVAYTAAALADPADVRMGIQLLNTPGTNAVLSVGEFPHPIQRALELTNDGTAQLVSPEFFGTRSQDLPRRFFDAGQLYFGHRPYWMERESITPLNLRLLELPNWAAVDIDTEDDWIRAEFVIRHRHQRGLRP